MSSSTAARISEDPQLRPFLSSHFDAQSFCSDAIEANKSEALVAELSRHILEVNEEIKAYITANKDSLMGGMQGVAELAQRYTVLSTTSEKLQRSVDKLKTQALDSHKVVAARTAELGRIHKTSATLRHLRQFVHSKSQLENTLSALGAEGGLGDVHVISADVRQLGSVARLVNELESLLKTPELQHIDFVTTNAPSVLRFGTSLREVTQSRLLLAVRDKDQSVVASCLQTFYNLDALPEVLLLAVDTTVKSTIDMSQDLLDLQDIVSKFSDGSKGLGSKIRDTKTNDMLIRSSLLEIVHVWGMHIYEQCRIMESLQRVIYSKEDPTTRQNFAQILLELGSQSHYASDGDSTTARYMQYLHNSDLVRLYWCRLMPHLRDVTSEKVRSLPQVALKLYPYLRRVCQLISQKFLQDEEKLITVPGGMGGGLSTSLGLFGTSTLPPTHLLHNTEKQHNSLNRFQVKTLVTHPKGLGEDDSDLADTSHAESIDLAEGLKPMRDRYLLAAFQRMTQPIHLMFPEMEGYTAAIPSKRDIMEFTKAITAELITASTESTGGGPGSLLRAVCKETQKAIRLMIAKIEAMVIDRNAESSNSENLHFSPNPQQENNAQLYLLLVVLREVFNKLPGVVSQAYADSDSASIGLNMMLNIGISITKQDGEGESEQETAATRMVIDDVRLYVVEYFESLMDELSTNLLLNPIVSYCANYCKSLLFTVPSEKYTANDIQGSGHLQSETDGLLQGASKAVKQVYTSLPTLLQAHLLRLDTNPKLQEKTQLWYCANEICLRILHAYVSASALIRPVDESTRIRIARDLTALESIISQIVSGYDSSKCPVYEELRAYRRFIFDKNDSTGSSTNSTGGQNENPKLHTPVAPTFSQLMQRPFIPYLRPSTLLGHLSSCAPHHLPPVYEGVSTGLMGYLFALTSLSANTNDRYIESIKHGFKGNVDSSVLHLVETNSTTLTAGTGQWLWYKNTQELEAWQAMQTSIDVLIQRTAVVSTGNGGDRRAELRAWADTLLEIGSSFFHRG
eukprot:GSChrysophyteH1.ASY1.ANO1.1768.1 assembled CDS